MKVLMKSAVVIAAAIAVIVGAAALNLRSRNGADEGDRALASAPSGSALLAPAAPAGSLDATVVALQGRLRAIPEDWRAYASLGLAYVAEARVTADPSWYPKAEGALRESLRLHREDNVEAVLGLGALALARHDFEVALEHGLRARELDPFDADVYGVIGDAQLELGRYGEAIETFQTMVDTRPDVASYARASYARELLGDVSGAIDAMRRAFEASGTPSDAA
ncbi:MAG TPA: tetratricopeptide repeat protein, partial [Actinomycetota bacterium]|nr:tetratricopeptide repeat protein [Actinomycetota bacterium]